MSAYRWVILAVCTLSFMQTHVHRVGFAPLIPTFIGDLGLTYAAAGTIMVSYFWTYTLMQVPVGVVTDRLGSRRVMLGCMALLVAGVIAFSLSRTYGQSLLSRCLVGLGAAATWLPGLRLIQEWFLPRERGLATGLFSAGGGIGGTAVLLLLPLLADRLGWRTAYAVLVIPVLITLALIFLLVRPGDAQATARGLARGSGGVVAGAPPEPGGLLSTLHRVLGTRALWPFNLSVLLSYGAYFALITWLPTFLVTTEGLSQAMAGFVTALITGGTIVSWPLGGGISDRLRRRKPVFLFSQAMSAVVCLAFAYIAPGAGLGGAVIIAAIAGVVLGGMVMPFVMVTELFPHELVGTASGVVNTFCFSGALLIPVALGYVLDATGSFRAAFAACGVIELGALAVAMFTRETGLARRAMMR